MVMRSVPDGAGLTIVTGDWQCVSTTKVVIPRPGRFVPDVRSARFTPAPSPDPALLARLHEPLLALHAAVDVEPLWRAIRALVRAAVPAHRVTLFLGHLGMGEARLVFTDPEIPGAARWYAERGQHNPFSPFIDRHRGRKLYRFDEVLPPPAQFRRTEFYRRFAAPEGWDKGVSVLYWTRSEVKSMFSLYRAPAEPDFSPAEIAALDSLYPFIGIAIDRVQLVHSERLARRGLEDFNKRLPVGLVTLDWDLRVMFANPEGLNACAQWNLGPDAARIFKSRECFALPAQLLAAARGLRETIERRNAKELHGQLGDVAQVAHPSQPGLMATLSVSNNPSNALARPRFLVVFDAWRTAAGQTAPTLVNATAALRELTPREREIALLVAAGHSNGEIAAALSKSVLTIKTQLNAVFRKLGLKRRAQLMPLLR
jgi:DNA-binding CsgD family transcriptional regulator